MSEQKELKKEDHILRYQKIVMYKVIDAELEQYVEQLFLVDIELDTEKYLEKQPCGCNYGTNIKAHEFFVKPIGVFMRCRIQQTSYGLIPDAIRNTTYPWSKIVKRKKLSVLEAKTLFASKKFVATPDIIIYLAMR